MEKMKWDARHSVNVFDMDENYQRLFKYINRIIDVQSKKKKDSNELIDVLVELMEFVKFHFKNEEAFLAKYKYPETEDHVKDHRQFSKKIQTFRRWISEDPNNFTEDMILYLEGWIINHIHEYDMKYGPYMRLNLYLQNFNRKKR
ncbi:MAG: hemerythrin family protein [Desulfobacterales bacterium]|nr:hemerythrin family protein [Desulfobacterales bacterium]